MKKSSRTTKAASEQYLQEIAQHLELLPTEKIAELLTEDEFGSEVMKAATISPDLMDKVADALKELPYPLSAADVEAATSLGQELAGKAIGDVLDVKEHSAVIGPTGIEQGAVPGSILRAASLLGKTAKEFVERLIGYSQPLTPLPAAAGAVTLIAGLNRFRGGQITLELSANGTATLRGRFDHPTVIFVSVYDFVQGRVLEAIALEEPGATLTRELRLEKGFPPKNVRVSLQSSLVRNLLLLVRR